MGRKTATRQPTNPDTPISYILIITVIIVVIIYLIVMYRQVEGFMGTNNNNSNNNSNNNNSNNDGKKKIPHMFIKTDVNPMEVKLVWQGKINNTDYLSFWQRKNKKTLDLYCLGQYATISKQKLTQLNQNQVEEIPILNMLLKNGKYPIKYDKIWSSDMIPSGQPKPETDFSIWKPIPPEGYYVMGDVVVPSLSKPLRSNVVCLPEKYVSRNESIRESIYPAFLDNTRLNNNSNNSNNNNINNNNISGASGDIGLSIWNVGNYKAYMASPSNAKPDNRKEEIKDITEELLSKKEFDPSEKFDRLHVTISTAKLGNQSNNTNNTNNASNVNSN